VLGTAWCLHAQQADILKQEADRVAVVEKVKPSVVAIFARGGQGGGSGVLITPDGYALTNFHVVQGSGPVMQCGLPDGVLYDAVLVGLDKVGDVGLIKLLPKSDGQKFPFTVLGDSDLVREGDWSLAMGNPFLLATDFQPTVTFGLVSGVHRYQYPAGTLLEYPDCIQIDTSINPGNSGGPLFNMKGELIGINGRGSFDKRGRVNSGVGYAISINQIKNFMGHLYAGLDTDHASLGALITTQTDRTGLGRMVVTQILEESDVYRRGMDLDDELLTFNGRIISSVNHFKNVLGLYPRGWRVPLEYRREQDRKEVLVRLMGVQAKVSGEDQPKPAPKPNPKGVPAPKGPPSPAAKFYQPKPGFANYYFNKVEQDRLLAAFKKHGDFAGLGGGWNLDGSVSFKKLTAASKFNLEIVEEKGNPIVRMKVGDFPYVVEPLKPGQEIAAIKVPETSGGFLAAMFLWQQFLTQGPKAFTGDFHYGGFEPLYPLPEGKMPASLGQLRVDTEVLNTRLGPFLVKWFFARSDQKLAGFEVRLQDNEDPCEVYLSDYRAVDGRQLPHRMQVLYGNGTYGTFYFSSFQLAAAK
jgi:S1-C subfamily serine protease